MATATQVVKGTDADQDDITVRVEIRELNKAGDGVGEALNWENTDALRRPRIMFKVDEDEARRLLRQFCEMRRAPIYELTASAVIGYELPPVGSLGWTKGRG